MARARGAWNRKEFAVLWEGDLVLACLPGMLIGYFVDDDVRGAERVCGIKDPHVAALAVEGKKRLESRDKRVSELQNRICHRLLTYCSRIKPSSRRVDAFAKFCRIPACFETLSRDTRRDSLYSRKIENQDHRMIVIRFLPLSCIACDSLSKTCFPDRGSTVL